MEIISVVSLVKLGTPGSYYLLVPARLKERLGLDESSEFVVLTGDDKIVYQRKIKGAS